MLMKKVENYKDYLKMVYSLFTEPSCKIIEIPSGEIIELSGDDARFLYENDIIKLNTKEKIFYFEECERKKVTMRKNKNKEKEFNRPSWLDDITLKYIKKFHNLSRIICITVIENFCKKYNEGEPHDVYNYIFEF